MTEEFIELLQTMQSNGTLEGFLCSQIPSGRLSSGWIENGLLFTSMETSLRSEAVTTTYMIPADRFVRFFKQLDSSAKSSICFSITGPAGLREEKSLVLVGEVCQSGSPQVLAARFSSSTATEICQFIASQLLRIPSDEDHCEPCLDYLEELRELVLSEETSAALCLSIPKATTLVREVFSQDSDQESIEGILLRLGQISQLQSFATKAVTWLDRTKKFQGQSSEAAAIVLRTSHRLLLCLWDGPRGVVSFADMTGMSLEKMSVSLLLPLWIVKGETMDLQDYAPRVLIDKENEGIKSGERDATPIRRVESFETISQELAALESRLNSVSLRDLSKRVMDLEDRFDSIKRFTQNASSDEKRISAAYSNIDDLISRLEKISGRLDKIADDLEIVSDRLKEE